MDKKLDSRDVGFECGFVACGRTDGDVIQKFANHVQAFHAVPGFPEELSDRIQSYVHEGKCETEASAEEELLCQACEGTCTC